MAAISDYLEGKLLNHIFRSEAFVKPSSIAIALTSSVPLDSNTGATLPELPTGVLRGATTVSTGYARKDLGSPSGVGDDAWLPVGSDSTTTYQVYSTEVGNSGYFYPLYLAQNVAETLDNNGVARTFTFPKTFPGVTFYSPSGVAQSGQAQDAGYITYEGNGFIKNRNQIIFNTALSDWGWVSGVAVIDTSVHGQGNMLMYAQLRNPRFIYTGDNIKFDPKSLEISLK